MCEEGEIELNEESGAVDGTFDQSFEDETSKPPEIYWSKEDDHAVFFKFLIPARPL